MSTTFDCIVIGSGNAGSSAAISAVENGCKRVLLVDKCPEEWVGGNGYFTAGAFRTVHGGLNDLLAIVRNVLPELASKIDIAPYTDKDFTDDINRMSGGRSDPRLVKVVVDESRDAIAWLAEHDIPFTLAFNRQAYEVDGRQKFWGGLALSTEDGGKGLIRAHQAALQKAGVEVWFKTRAMELVVGERTVIGVVVEKNGKKEKLTSRTVILASGGYESNAQLRAEHLGPDWANARVRGAKLAGDWKGCHSTCWDANAHPDTGDRVLSNQYTKSGYPLGIMVNSKGVRFVDEGEDIRNFTYAKFGREILYQPGGYVFQVWDSKITGWLRKEEYGDDIVEKMWADSVEELAEKLSAKGLEDKEALARTIRSYNDAVLASQSLNKGLEWNPAEKDGLSTDGLSPPKSNWALTIDRSPFLAVKVACGITFTFGGVAVDPDTTGVISETTGMTIKGLYCTGEMVGGLWYGNYPGGSGLTAGAVLGRKAGRAAAEYLKC